MGRPRGFSESAVLEAAADTFVRGGYEGTSIDDLVQALKLHRGSLYKAFGSKHGLFVAVLRHYVQAGLPAGIDRSCRYGEHGAHALLCSGDLDLLLVAALERGPADAEVAGLVRGALDLLERALEDAADSTPPPASAGRPDRALDLLGSRLYQRLHDGPDRPGRQPRTTTKEQ